jgi:hypothetical protein
MGKMMAIAAVALLCAVSPCVCLEANGYPAEYRVTVETLENGTTVESFRWGSLKVTFESFVDERYAATARVIDPSGATLLELRSTRFITPSLTEGGDDFTREFFLDLFGDGGNELKITAWSGGAYGCYCDRIYSYDETNGLRNVLAYDGGEGRIGKGSDDLDDDDELNAIARSVLLPSRGKAVPDLVLVDYGLHTLGGETHGSAVFAVLRWKRDQYVVANGDRTEISERAIERYRRHVDDALSAAGGDGIDCDLLSAAVVSDIVGYLSNAAMIGRFDQGLAWVRERLIGAPEVQASAEKDRAFRRLETEYFDPAKDAPRRIGESIGVDRRTFLYLN